jgi:hypothetical protein
MRVLAGANGNVDRGQQAENARILDMCLYSINITKLMKAMCGRGVWRNVENAAA